MAATSSTGGSIGGSEVSENDHHYRRGMRNSLNEFLAANNVAAAVVATSNTNSNSNNHTNSNSSNNNSNSNSKLSATTTTNNDAVPMAAIYPQPLEAQIENDARAAAKSKENQDTQPLTNCKARNVAANGHADKSPTSATAKAVAAANALAIQKDRRLTPPMNIRKSHHKVKINATSVGFSTAISAPSPYTHFPPNTAASLVVNSYNRSSRMNNTPLIAAAPHFTSNQLVNKNPLITRREHQHRSSNQMNLNANVGVSALSTTNYTNSTNILLTANSHHHHHHHHHHHATSASAITDQLLIASLAAVTGRHHDLSAAHHNYGAASAAAAAAAAASAASSLSYHHQKPKIVIKPFKIHDPQPLVTALADSTLVDTIVSKVSTATVAAAESAARRSRSRSRRSRSRVRREGGGTSRRSTSRSRSSHYSSSSSRSRSRTSRSRSHSHSSRSSCSSRSSSRSSSSSTSGSSRSGSRSPSIPRRRGSPSFLDRRRITSARKRPIPYHRKTPSDASSFCSSCYSRGSSPHSPSRSPTRSSRSPSTAF